MILACTGRAPPPGLTDDSSLSIDDSERTKDSDTGSQECGDHWIDLDTGTASRCGVTSGGCIKCWHADSDWAQFLLEPPEGSFLTVSIIDYWDPWDGPWACAGTESEVKCWEHAEANRVLPEGQYSELEAQNRLTCGIRMEDQALVCAGEGVRESGASEQMVVEWEGPYRSVSVAKHIGAWCATRSSGGLDCAGTQPIPPITVTFDWVWVYTSGIGCVAGGDGPAKCWYGPTEADVAEIASPTDSPVARLAPDAAANLSSAEHIAAAPMLLLLEDGSLHATGDYGWYLPAGDFADVQVAWTDPPQACGITRTGEIECWAFDGSDVAQPPEL